MLTKPIATDPELVQLLHKFKGYEMSADMKRQQRISWVYGNLPADNPLTREQVAEIVDEHYFCAKNAQNSDR